MHILSAVMWSYKALPQAFAGDPAKLAARNVDELTSRRSEFTSLHAGVLGIDT